MTSPQHKKLVSFLKRLSDLPPPQNYHDAKERENAITEMCPLLHRAILMQIDIDGVPGAWVTAPDLDSDQVVLYLHGGAYVGGSIYTHQGITSHLSQKANVKVLSVNYRLAPQHPFPAGLNDAKNAYRWLLKNAVPPECIVVAGDSAGGGLALALMLSLRDDGEPLPAGAVLLSPWVDLTLSAESVATHATVDPWIEKGSLEDSARSYARKTTTKNPLVSPLFANLEGLPPMMIVVGGREILLHDSTRLAEKASSVGVEVVLEIWYKMVHVFPFFASMLPEGEQALKKIALFMRGCYADAGSNSG